MTNLESNAHDEGRSAIDPRSPVAAGTADPLDPRNQGPGPLDTPYRRNRRDTFDAKAEIARTKTEVAVEAMADKIGEVAIPIDERGVVTNLQHDVEQLRDTTGAHLADLCDDERKAEKEAVDFQTRERRPAPAPGSYNPNANQLPLMAGIIGLGSIEAVAVGLYMGPYLPGGDAEGFLMACGSGLVTVAVAAAVGGFAWRARNIANGATRLLARAVLVLGPLAVLAMFFSLAAYRVHLESGQPIQNWLENASVGSVLFVLFNCALFGFAVWKFRGGPSAGWTDYWGEAPVDRRWREARDRREQAEAFYRDQLNELFDVEISAAREAVGDAQDQLVALRKDATNVIAYTGREAAAVHADATRTIADLQKYESTFREQVPGATFVEVKIIEPAFPNARDRFEIAFGAAEARLVKFRHDAADIDRRLAKMREEALANFTELATDLRRKRPAAIPGTRAVAGVQGDPAYA